MVGYIETNIGYRRVQRFGGVQYIFAQRMGEAVQVLRGYLFFGQTFAYELVMPGLDALPWGTFQHKIVLFVIKLRGTVQHMTGE